MADATSTSPGQQQQARNPILDAIIAVLQDGKDQKVLRDAVQTARAEMADLRQEMANTLEKLEPSVRQAVVAQVQQVEQSVSNYETGLDLIETFYNDQQANTLMRGGEWVRRGNMQINEALYNLRSGALLAMGPTDIPDFNFAHRLYQKIKSGADPTAADAFKGAVERFYQMTVLAQKDTQTAPPSTERETILATYRRHLEALETLRQYTREGRPELLEKGIEELRQSFTGIRDMVPAMNMKMRTSGPSKSPMANFVINLAMELAAGQIGDQAFRDALDQLRGTFQASKREFESLARSNIDSVLLAEEAQKVREALAEEEAAIDELYRFFDVREGLLLGNGCNRLMQAVDQLHESHKTFMDIAEREGKTLCIKCQHYNDRERRTCERCGAILIQATETSVPSTFMMQMGEDEALPMPGGGDDRVPMYENTARIFKAVNAVAEGQITLEEFEAEVAWLEDVVETHANAYGARPHIKLDTVPSDQREQVEEIVHRTDQAEQDMQEAADHMREGLALFRQYIEDGNKDNLVEGTRSIWAGNTKLHEIQTAMAPLKEKGGQAEA